MMGSFLRFATFLLLPLILAVSPARIYSQNSDEIQWIPLETPQLSRSELQWLDAMTRIPDPSAYTEAVNFIENQTLNGSISSADRAAVQILRRIALSPYSSRFQGPDPGEAPIQTRINAVKLLSYIGGDYSLDTVDELIARERDAAVLIELFNVYREISPPFNDFRHEQFAAVLRRASLIDGNEQLTLAILAAIKSMHLRTWSMTSQNLFDEILSVIQSGLRIEVRRQALDLARLIAGVEIDVD
jgi:hypothetical protein